MEEKARLRWIWENTLPMAKPRWDLYCGSTYLFIEKGVERFIAGRRIPPLPKTKRKKAV